MKVTILHPDLGIGGAERLIVDAAIALQEKGHNVKIVTNHYDPSHAFRETTDLNICTVVNWMPRSIFGKMHALCAYLKMMIAAIFIAVYYKPDVILSDTVSASQWVLKHFTKARLVFYCHFPDMLLTKRETTAKSVYRSLIDWIEEYTTSLADAICVNSNFTSKVVQETFKTLENRKELIVLYPSLNTEFFDSIEKNDEILEFLTAGSDTRFIFTSLNRYERKKNVKLALDSFAKLRDLLGDEQFAECHLVIAGGYDLKNRENIDYFDELVDHAQKLELAPNTVTFLKSPSDEQKVNLIRKSRATLYTPDREHFGIVPVESMYLGTPVIAVNTGGPCESIKNDVTGFLVDQTAEQFALKMQQLVENEQKWMEMSEAGTERVHQLFAFDAFATRLDRIIQGDL